MLLATGVRRAWLEQTNGTYLPVLIVRHCEGSDIYIRSKCEPLTPALECHLIYEEPPQRRIADSTLNRLNREFDKRERLIWDTADHDELRQLHDMGHQPASNKSAVRLQKALVRHEAKTQRDAAKAAQQTEKDRRQIIREERKRAKAEREAEPAKQEPEPTPTPEPTPKPELKIEPVPKLIDFKIQALIRQIQQQRLAVAT